MNRRSFLASAATLAAIPLVLRGSEPSVKVAGIGGNLTTSGTGSHVKGIDYDALLWAIAAVETGHDDTRVGPCGSRSMYQISETVWKQHIDRRGRPFSYRNFATVCRGNTANEVAYSHLRWLDANIPRRGVLECDFREYALAWAWRGGIGSWLKTQPWKRGLELNNYAARVSNLYVERTKVS